MNNFHEYKNKSVLVTGGAGFIGSHLVERLVELGAHVTIIDNFSTGSHHNIAHLSSKITVIDADIRSAHDVDHAIRECSHIFHCAAFTSVPASFEQPALCHAINVEGTRMLLHASITHKINTFVFSSSSAVYGNKPSINHEDDLPNPASPYAQSKLTGELLCKQFAKEYKLNTVCLRYFNVYGPRQNPQGSYAAVVAQFREKLEHGEPITIFGDGHQTRDFIPVHEVVEANLSLGLIQNIQGECFNIASGTSISINQLLTQLSRELNKQPVSLSFEPARPGDILYSQASCEKYKNRVKY